MSGIGYSSPYKGELQREQLQHPEKYIDSRPIVYRSALEWRFFKAFDRNPSFLQWASEIIRIPYQNPLKEFRMSMYYPDIFAVMKTPDGNKINVIIEIKPQSELDAVQNFGLVKPNTKIFFRACQNKAKWTASEEYCKEQTRTTGERYEFLVLTDKDVLSLG